MPIGQELSNSTIEIIADENNIIDILAKLWCQLMIGGTLRDHNDFVGMQLSEEFYKISQTLSVELASTYKKMFKTTSIQHRRKLQIDFFFKVSMQKSFFFFLTPI